MLTENLIETAIKSGSLLDAKRLATTLYGQTSVDGGAERKTSLTSARAQRRSRRAVRRAG